MTLLALLLACAKPDPAPLDSTPALPDDSGAPEDSLPPQDSPADSAPPEDTADTGEAPDSDPPEDSGEPDAGHPVEPPPWPTYSEGACPTLVASNNRDLALNEGFQSAGFERSFRLLVPSDYDGSRPLPLVMGWHWLNASSSSFIREGELETAIEELDFIAVFPDSLGDLYLFDWPFFETYGVEGEVLFTQDMLACITEQYNVDPYQVHAVGVSAGALWVTYLSTTEHVDRFASVMSLSGGLGEAFGIWEMAWVPQARKFPAFVLNGGPADWLAVDFYASSARYVEELRADGHFVVACEHDQGHAMPPFEAPEGHTLFYSLWSFMFDHPYDLPAGASPWAEAGVPGHAPSWCGIAE